MDPQQQLQAMAQALQAGRIDESERLYRSLCETLPLAREMHVFPTLFAIQRGRLLEALQAVSDLAGDPCPELRVLCLHLLGDPVWEGQALALLDHADPHVRLAMRHLLGRPADDAA